jgi:hypothetical protein
MATLAVSPAASPLTAYSGRRLIDAADATLTMADEMLAHWRGLEPIVRELVRVVRAQVEAPPPKAPTTAAQLDLLQRAAMVVDRLSRAGATMFKVSEGQARLMAFLSGGIARRPDPGRLSERQLVGVVLEVARRVATERGACPLCGPPSAGTPGNGGGPAAELG